MTKAARSPLVPLALLAGAVLLGACGGGDKTVAPGEDRQPAQMQVVSGGDQSGVVGTELPAPLVVRVLNAKGKAVSGQVVNFRVVKGNGSVFAGTAITNADGLAQERWTLGTAARDTQQVEARVVDPKSGEPIVFATFRAVGRPAAAAQLVKLAGDGSTGTVGEPLPDSLAVRLVDAYGNGVGGTVQWTAASGSLSATTTVTDALGRAAVRWTLGNVAGPQQSSAKSGSLPQVVFAATAHGGVPATISRLTADGGQYPVGGAVGDSVAVRVVDAYGNPSAGATVTFAITAGNGTLAPTTAIASSDGIARTRWVVGTVAGQNVLHVSAGSGVALDFTVTGRAAGASSVSKNGADPASGVVGSAVSPRPSVTVRDAYGNPIAGLEVIFAVTAGGGQLSGAAQVTDANGVATVGSWTLGTVVGANGLSATVSGLPAVGFATTATAGPLASLTVFSGNEQRAPVGTQLVSPLVVRAADAYDNAISGVVVTWAVTQGGGTLSGGSSTTDAQGKASVYWSVGTTAGANTATATAPGVEAATFTATGTVGKAVSLTTLSPNPTTGTVGKPLADSLAVVARDGAGVPVPGVTVSWAPSAGSVSPATSVTGSDGVARTRFTLGPATGAQSVVASAAGLPSVQFDVTANPVRVAKVKIGSHPDTMLAGQKASLSAVATDANGNAMAVSLYWRSTNTSVLTYDTGVATAVHAGTALLIALAQADNVADTAKFVVLEPVSRVNVDLARGSVHVGDTTKVRVTLLTPLGDTVNRAYTVSVRDTSVASYDAATHVLTAKQLGGTYVDVTSEAANGSAWFSVVPTGAKSIVLTPDTLRLIVPDTARIVARVVDSTGATVPNPSVIWRSTSPLVATVNNGLVTAVDLGGTFIIASMGGVADTTVVYSQRQVSKIWLRSSDAGNAVAVGDSIAVEAVIEDSRGQRVHVIPNWTSSDPTRAVVGVIDSTHGFVKGLSAGDVTISATARGVTGSQVYTVMRPIQWSAMSSGTAATLRAVWGRSASDVYAVGDGGTVIHYDGSAWRSMSFPASTNLTSVWRGRNGVFAGTATSRNDGQPATLYYYDGATWADLTGMLPAGTDHVWASDTNDIFATVTSGSTTVIRHYSGGTWTQTSVSGVVAGARLWGTSATDVWVVSNVAARYNGTSWTSLVDTPDGGQARLYGDARSPTLVYRNWGEQNLLWPQQQPDGSWQILSFLSSHYPAEGLTTAPDAAWIVATNDVFTTQGGRIERNYGSLLPIRGRAEDVAGNFIGIWGDPNGGLIAVGAGGAIMRGTPAP